MCPQTLKVAVTGASGGLGRLLVDRLLGRNATVFAIDRAFATPSVGGELRIEADLSQPQGLRIAVDTLDLSTGELDLLVNCAAVFTPDTSGDEAWSDVDLLLRNNLTSTVFFTLEIEHLLRRGSSPSVVNIGSTDGVVASAGQDCEIGVAHDLFYAMSKGALITFTRALAMKWAPLGIRVNIVCPTVFASPMTEDLLNQSGKAEELAMHLPLGRLATTTDVTDAIMGLHAMRFTTGHMLPVDGGYL